MFKTSVIFSFLFALAMAGTFFGKSIIGITLGVTVLFSLVVIAKERKAIFNAKSLQAFIKAREIWAIGFLFLCWLVSTVMAYNIDLSMPQYLSLSGIIVGGFIIHGALTRLNLDFVLCFKVVSIIAAVCSALMVLTPIYKDVVALEWRSSYGSVLALIFPMTACLALTEKVRGMQFLWWGILLLMAMAIFASGGRTAWIVFIAVTVCLPFFFPRKSVINPLGKYVLMAALIGIASLSGLTSYKQNVGETIYQYRTEAMTNMERPASGRLQVWANSLPHIEENLVFGVGMRGTRVLDIEKSAGQNVIHIHNAVLELTLETGLLGLFAFTIVICSFVFGFLKAYMRCENKDLKAQAMAVFLSCVAYGLASMALTSIFNSWWFFYLIVLLIMLKVAERRLRLE